LSEGDAVGGAGGVQSAGGARNQSKPLVPCRKLKKAAGGGQLKQAGEGGQ